MEIESEKVQAAAAFLQKHLRREPRIGMLSGTGLAESVPAMEVRAELDYRQIPHFPLATVQSHSGRLLIGSVDGRPLLAMQGRFHLYEGYKPREVIFPVRVMQALGVETLVLTNAAGGLCRDFCAGDVMAIADHINLTGHNPLVGPHEPRWGPRFPDMTRAYDPHLRELACDAGRRAGINVRQGVYAGLLGPSLETPAEVRFLQTIGAHAVGFSTVQEAIAAVHAGMRVLALSTITNVNDPQRPQPASVEEISKLFRELSASQEKRHQTGSAPTDG